MIQRGWRRETSELVSPASPLGKTTDNIQAGDSLKDSAQVSEHIGDLSNTWQTQTWKKTERGSPAALLWNSGESPDHIVPKQFQEFMSKNGLKVCKKCGCMHVCVQVSKLWRRRSMTYSGAEFGKSCYCANICRSMTGDKHLLSGRLQNLGSELNEGKTKGNRGKHVFCWVDLQDVSQGKKKTYNSYFWAASIWQMARTFQFPMIAIVWCRLGVEPRPPSTHTDTRAQHSASGHLGLPVAAGTGRALPICSHSKKPGVRGLALYRERERRLRRDLSRSLKGQNLFSPFSPSCLFFLGQELETLCRKVVLVVRGEPKILGAFIKALLKVSFELGINTSLPLCRWSV